MGACPDWDRLGYRGAFVWGFMACEAALPAWQEAPIGTRLARGAQGRGQEEGEGGDSTALLRLQHRFGLMAAPGPFKPHAQPCVILAVVSLAWHHPWMGRCCWIWPCPQVPAAAPSTSMSQGEDSWCDISHPAAWLWWEHMSPRPAWCDLCPYGDLGSPNCGPALSRGIHFPGPERCTLAVEGAAVAFPLC